MKNMGVFFEIPNDSIDNISHLLEPIPFYEYKWLINGDEILTIRNNQVTNEDLFKEEDKMIDGEKLYNIVKFNKYYTIFVNLYAFPKYTDSKVIQTYEEFIKSDCKIMILIFDSSYVIFLCKDSELVSKMYNYVITEGYDDVVYISDKDLIERKYYIN